jgi:hypothetical protein
MIKFSQELMEKMHGDAAVLNYLNMIHEQYISGEREAILGALLVCATYQAIIPDWVTDELLSLEDKINSGEKKDLNDFFGIKFDKHKAINAKEYNVKKDSRKVYPELFNHRLLGGNFTTGDGLEEVAEKTNVPRRIVEEIYRQNKEKLKALPTKVESNTIYGYGDGDIPLDLGRRYGRSTLKD